MGFSSSVSLWTSIQATGLLVLIPVGLLFPLYVSAFLVVPTDEQRSQAGCIGVQDWHRYSVTGPKSAGYTTSRNALTTAV